MPPTIHDFGGFRRRYDMPHYPFALRVHRAIASVDVSAGSCGADKEAWGFRTFALGRAD